MNAGTLVDEAADGGEAAAADAVRAMMPNETLDQVQPGSEVGAKRTWTRGSGASQSRTLTRLCAASRRSPGGAPVGIGRRRARGRRGAPGGGAVAWRVPVTFPVASRARRTAWRCCADAVVGALLVAPGGIGSVFWGPVQRLDPRLLVHTQHDCAPGGRRGARRCRRPWRRGRGDQWRLSMCRPSTVNPVPFPYLRDRGMVNAEPWGEQPR